MKTSTVNTLIVIVVAIGIITFLSIKLNNRNAELEAKDRELFELKTEVSIENDIQLIIDDYEYSKDSISNRVDSLSNDSAYIEVTNRLNNRIDERLNTALHNRLNNRLRGLPVHGSSSEGNP